MTPYSRLRGGGLFKTAVAVAILKFADDYLLLSLFAAAAMVILPALTAVRLWRIGSQGRPSLWSRIIAGRTGKWIFRFAGVGLPARRAAPAPGEPTALALGHSIEALYAALPDAHQKRLAAVPDLEAVRRLGEEVDRVVAANVEVAKLVT